MNTLISTISELQSHVNKDQKWVIFDVDRVIINTTSWFQACITPNLLISTGNIEQFIKINNGKYTKNTTNTTDNFRRETLELFTRKITYEFIRLLKQNSQPTEKFTIDSYINNESLYAAGYYMGSRVHIYKEPFQYLRYLKKLYGENLNVLYLSAGYQPFIKGFIDSVYQNKKMKQENYHVFGSEINFSKGKGHEYFHCFGVVKQKVAEAILVKKASIVFAVDDDINNNSLLQVVAKNGGETLLVAHKSNQLVNQSWIDFLKVNLSLKKINNELIQNDYNFSLYKKFDIKNEYPKIYDKFNGYINKIGIIVLPIEKYNRALDKVLDRTSLPEDKEKLQKIFSEFSYKKNNNIYLRGKFYYYCLPPYVFPESTTPYEKWYQTMDFCHEAIQVICKNKLLDNWAQIPREEKFLYLCIIDHYKNAVYTVFNTICCLILKDRNSSLDAIFRLLDIMTKNITSFYYSLIFDFFDNDLFHKIIQDDNSKIINTMRKYKYIQKGMRELDDPYIILFSVLSLLQQIKDRKLHYELLISFPCGGLELGLTLLSVYKLLYNNNTPPDIVHCYYSSKKNKRENYLVTEGNDKEWLQAFIPLQHQKKLNCAIKKNYKILLYDNNVTTFTTIAQVKEYFKTHYDRKTDAAVSAVFYKNICKYLSSKKKFESLHTSWRKTLDYQPIAEYITAFNTWGTSQKAKTLESIFFSNKSVEQLTQIKSTHNMSKPIFKVCRIHNIYDLQLTLENGMNMIGIHAVYYDRLKYNLTQKPYKPFYSTINYPDKLPLSTYECNSIKNMQKYIPSYIKQAIIFERPTKIPIIRQTREAYGLSNKKIYIQLQYRVNYHYIQSIKKNITQHIIVAIGALQNDFNTYFQQLQAFLDPKKDFILLDMSKHQPDVIHNKSIYKSENKFVLLERLTTVLKKSEIPILLADDVEVDTMKKYLQILKRKGITIAGIDMQNNLELPTNEQRYCEVSHNQQIYQMRIRKSPEKMYEWKGFFN